MRRTRLILGALAALLLATMGIILAMAGERPAARPPEGKGAGEVRELAPIEQVRLVVAESHPPQYFVQVTFGLPNGCYQPGSFEVERAGGRIDIKVYVTRPAGEELVCTMIYRTVEQSIALGSEFEPGQSYTVVVNGKQRVSFTARAG